MTDLLVVLVTLTFFALCAGYVQLCDRVIGPDDIAAAPVGSADAPLGLEKAA